MKLVIDINENCYNSVKFYDGDIMNEWSDHIGCAIFYGTTLEKVLEGIKAEIETKMDYYSDFIDQNVIFGFDRSIKIIDKHISGGT